MDREESRIEDGDVFFSKKKSGADMEVKGGGGREGQPCEVPRPCEGTIEKEGRERTRSTLV